MRVSGGNLNALLAVGVGLADGAVAVSFGYRLTGIVDGLGRSFLGQRLNVTRFIVDVGDVDVDEPQADFFKLRFHIIISLFY